MSTYQQSSFPGPLEPQRPGRRRPNDGGRIPPAPADQFRRRLLLIAIIGVLLAPVVWAMRGDGEKFSGTESGGAAAIVQMEPSSDSSSTTSTLSVIITAAATLPPTTTAPANRVCAQKYVVQSGDSWYGIAAEAGVSASLIAGSNNTTIQAPLSPGQEICLPSGAAMPANRSASVQNNDDEPQCGLEYTVQYGDSWYGIASRAGVKAGPLATLNGRTLSSPLRVGQVLCLPEGARRPSATTTTQPRATTSGSTSTNDMRNVAYNPSRTYSRTEIEQIVRDIWPDNLENDALFVVGRESRFNPGSRSYCCIGLFQLNWSAHKSWMAAYGVTDPAQLLDPTTNTRMALVARERAGSWRPWCTSSWCPTS
jgi:LysM repeat protein